MKPIQSPARARLSATLAGALGALMLAAAPVGQAQAQAWPNKPIRFVVGNAPGGTTDLMARIVGEPLKDRIGQPVTIDNRPGAGSMLAIEHVAKAPNDGYTFVVSSSSIATLHTLNANATYNPKDFAPVAGIAIAPFLVMVRAEFPAKNLQEFVAYAKANPGKVTVAAAGSGSFDHLAGTKFALATGTNMLWIPYKGEVGAVPEVVAGRNDAAFLQWGLSGPHITSGKIRVLASLSPKRHPALPNIPTAAEQGVPVEAAAWFAVFAPTGTPRDVIQTLNREINGILKTPEATKRILGINQEPMIMTPEQLGDLTRTSADDWTRVIKAANLKVE